MREHDESRECRQCRTVCAGIPRISQSTSEKWGELLSFMRVGASRWGMGPLLCYTMRHSRLVRTPYRTMKRRKVTWSKPIGPRWPPDSDTTCIKVTWSCWPPEK